MSFGKPRTGSQLLQTASLGTEIWDRCYELWVIQSRSLWWPIIAPRLTQVTVELSSHNCSGLYLTTNEWVSINIFRRGEFEFESALLLSYNGPQMWTYTMSLCHCITMSMQLLSWYHVYNMICANDQTNQGEDNSILVRAKCAGARTCTSAVAAVNIILVNGWLTMRQPIRAAWKI